MASGQVVLARRLGALDYATSFSTCTCRKVGEARHMRAHQLITRSDTLIMNSLLRQESWRRNAADSFERALTLTDFRQDHDIAG